MVRGGESGRERRAEYSAAVCPDLLTLGVHALNLP